MSVFVFVHGAWHGGWVWERVIPLVEREGHAGRAPDLPAHGEDPTPISEVTLDSYAERVAAVLDGLLEPAILVGHSMGGIAISQAAELRPERVRRLVYLAAYLVPSGRALAAFAREDESSELPPHLRVSREAGAYTVADSGLREIVYGSLSDAEFESVRSRLRPDPLRPIQTPLSLSAERFGRVPRAYIECGRDRVISPGFQRRMCEWIPCERVVRLDAGHSPHFLAPDLVVEALLSLV